MADPPVKKVDEFGETAGGGVELAGGKDLLALPVPVDPGDGLAKTTVSVAAGAAAADLTVRATTAMVRARSIDLPVALLLPIMWRVPSRARNPTPPRDTGPRP